MKVRVGACDQGIIYAYTSIWVSNKTRFVGALMLAHIPQPLGGQKHETKITRVSSCAKSEAAQFLNRFVSEHSFCCC
jgi:hypothetical protein